MDCRTLQDRIDRYLAADLPAAELAAARAHVAGCADCAGIVAALSAPGGESDLPLTRNILARTSGPVCEQAQDRLVGDPRDPLAAPHREECAECRRFAETVAWMDVELPGLAEMPAGEGFVEAVLDRTTRRPRVPGWSRVRRLWSDWAQRPGFAAEFAYVATVVLVMLTATPVSPLRPVAQESLRWLQSDAKAEALPLEAAEAGASQVGQVADGIRGDLSERTEQVSVVWKRINGHRVELGDALLAGDLERAGPVLRDLGCDARLLWRSVRKRLPQGEEPTCGDQ